MQATDNKTEAAYVSTLEEDRKKWRKTPEWQETNQRISDALNTPQEVERTTSKGKVKKVTAPALGDRQIISARELWLYCVGNGKPINWIESYKALLKYVSKDYVAIFRPTVKGDNSGTRYYVKADDVADFLYMFENNKL